MQRDGDLAVVGLAQRARVLARHAHRVTALLGKAGVVDDDHAFGIVKCSTQTAAVGVQHGLLVPHALIDEQLQRLLRIAVPAGHVHPTTQRFDALAFAVQQQALEVDACPARASDVPEVTGELGDILLESLDTIRFQFHYRRPCHVATLRRDPTTR